MTQDNRFTKKDMVDSHLEYPDIMPKGLENYPFVYSRIIPIIYEIPECSSILDVGCNSGEFMKYLKDMKKCDVYGFDVSDKCVQMCKDKGLDNVFSGDAEHMPFEDGTFDFVCLMEVLEHFHEPVKYLKEIKRVLKKDGVLIGSCPHKNLEKFIWDDQRLHHQYYDEKEIMSDFEQVFEKTYLRILNGAQFSASFSHSLISSEPAEILFKCGSKNLKEWEYEIKKDNRLKVWMGPTQNAGVVYYRMTGFSDYMRKYGVDVAYEAYKADGSESQMMWQYRLGPDKKIVQNQLEDILNIAEISVWEIVQTSEALAFLECVHEILRKPVITEIDDWLFDLPAYNIASHPYHPFSEKEQIAHEQIKFSDALIVSTQYMLDHLKTMFPKKPMYLIPNGLDFNIWDKLEMKEDASLPKKEAGMIRIGYTGCGNHDGDLRLIVNPIRKIIQDFKNVEFVYAQPFPSFGSINHPRIKCLNRWVPIDKVPQDYKNWNMDIGIAPLRDNDFNRSKSNLRWLEYSGIKVPTVCSNVYPFKHSVKQGDTGLICKSELDWYEALKSLIVDEGERIRMGNSAYTKVKKDFNMAKIAMRYKDVLETIKCNSVKFKTNVAAS